MQRRITSLVSMVLVSVAVAATIAGCGGATPADVCEHACECEASCTPASEKSCERQGQDTMARAQRVGCADRLEAYEECFVGLACRAIPSSPCAREASALERCLSGGEPPHQTGHGSGSSSGSGGAHPGSGAVTSTSHAGATTGGHTGIDWRCAETDQWCICTDQNFEGYDQTTCHQSWSCCWKANFSGSDRNDCECTEDTSSCAQTIGDWKRVDSCP